VDFYEYRENLDENIANLVKRLKQKNYRAKIVRRQYIPKINGKLRPLGISATDDFVCAFQYQKDAELFYQQLNERLGKFGLEVCPEKTRVLLFSRSRMKESETFDFLGFEFRRALSRKFKAIIRRRTSRKKLRASIAGFAEWIKTNRNKKISKLMITLRAKYRGYWNYYGVIGNYDSLETFYYYTIRILFKWLNRRNQRLSYNWAGFKDLLTQFAIPAPKIIEKYPSKQLKLFV